jgi:protein-tyrosine phosphatase
MDRANARDLGGRAVLMLDFVSPKPLDPDVPDPYYSGAFDEVYALVDAASGGLLDHVAREHALG